MLAAILLAEVGEQAVVVGTLYLGVANVGGVALDGHGVAGTEHDVGLRVVGVEQRGRHVVGESPLVAEAAIVDAHCVEAGKVAALGIEVELALVDVFKMPFQAGRAFVGAAPCRQEGYKQDEGCAEVVCEVHGLGLVALG